MEFFCCGLSPCPNVALTVPVDKVNQKIPNQISYIRFGYCRRIKHVLDHTPYTLVKRTHTKKPMLKMTTRQKALASARHRVLSRQRAKMEIVQKNKKEEKEEEEATKDGKDAKCKFWEVLWWF